MATLAVTGSTGAVGGLVARALAERGIEQRLIVRDAARAPQLAGAEVAVASGYGAEAEMRAALAGVRTLFLVSAAESADRVEQHRAAVAAAAAAGVERVVYTSFLGAAADCTFTLGRDHWATEQAIREAGLAFTSLADSFYADFMPLLAGPERVIRGPGGDGRLAAVSRADVAAVAVEVLAADGAHDGETLELTGPELLGFAAVAERLQALTGIAYAYVEETVEEAWASRRPSGAPDWMIEAWVSTYTAVADGSMEVLSDDVERLTGRPPQTLEQCLAANPELLAA